ncbi:MAG: hypothetical protein KAW17_12580 [Candidatus Eisenbacteria sp.]|nr:hypothetical protein [Candidatus Eisenbacteria bacterium]
MRRIVLGMMVPLLLSGGPVFRFLGWWGLGAYWILGAVACAFAVRLWREFPPDKWLSRRSARIGIILILLLYAAAFSIVYPIADSGRIGGGSDRDDALNLATSRLFAGEYPYAEPTHLGKPISPLPGGLILSALWVLGLGNAAWQNLLWLLVLFLLMARITRSEPAALCIFIFLTMGSVALQHELMTGGDLLANSIAVTTVAVVAGLGGRWSRGWRMAVLAVFAGLALAWRANFFFVLPLLVVRMGRTTGWREASVFTGVCLLTSAAVIVPVWMWDPEHFTPIHGYYEIGYLDAAFPCFGKLVVGAMAVVSLGLAAAGNSERWLRHAALVQILPIAAAGLAVGIRCPWCALTFLQFGLMPLFLWVGDLAVAKKLS